MATNPAECLSFVVDRPDWTQGHFETTPVTELSADQVLFRIDRFAFTSNNVTYAAAGEMLDYWGFFPAPKGSGRIPAMGYADVAASRHPDVAEGERVFGFFPMATHLVIDADEVNAGGFVDGVAHRRKHAQAYRQYGRVKLDPSYDAAFEDETMLLRGLFMTSFLVDGFLADHDGFGARTYVVGSASSKTAIALAFLLSRQGRGRVVGVTSPRNRAFVEGLGYYDETLTYDAIDSLPQNVPTAFIDHSGDGDFVSRLHHHLAEQLKHSCIVGATHWDAGARPEGLPGAEPAFFFAPGEIKTRVEAWGPAGFQQRLGEGWQQFRDASRDWMRVTRGQGSDAVKRVFDAMVAGKASPDEGHVLSLWDA